MSNKGNDGIIDGISLKKIIVWFGLIISAPVIMLLVINWLFSMHGTMGTYLWMNLIRYIVLFLLFIAFATPFIAFLDVVIPFRTSSSSRKPRRIVKVFCLTSIIIPLGFAGVIGVSLVHPAGSTAPQLLVCDGTGEFGIPDMAVTFWTQQKTINTFQWGNGTTTNSEEEAILKNQHAFILDNLLPETEYWYQINSAGKNYTFTTLSSNNDTIKFAVSSDPHFGHPSSRNDVTLQLLEHISNPINNIDMLFMLGDFVELGFIDYSWNQGLNAISPYTTSIPYRPLIGNHDTIFGGLQYYLDYSYPETLPLDTGSRLWYRIDINNIHFFLMDLEWGIEEYSEQQKAWFEEQIATVPDNDWTIVMSHCFYYSSGVIDYGRSYSDHAEMIQAFEPLFIEHDVDLVFSGHNHHWEFLNKSGIIYNVVGAFGGRPDHQADIMSTYSLQYQNIQNDMQYGFTEVEISGDNATLTFRNRLNNSLYQIVVNR